MEKYLAEDMVVAILLLLPIKSLVRFRCVCKLWYQIIGSTDFINDQNDITNNQYLLCEYPDFYSLYDKEEILNYNYEPLLLRITPTSMVYGFCKGLLCVSDIHFCDNSVIYLFNPIIRKAKRITNISFDVPEQRGNTDLCLGYFNGDYKVVKIALFSGVFHVGVYSLRSNSWKKFTCFDSHDCTVSLWYSSPPTFVNGVAYFVKYQDRIVCFDVYHETITELEFPEKFGHGQFPDSSWFVIEAYEESIALVEIKDRLVLSVWVLKNCMWEMKFRVGLPNCHTVLFLSKSNTYFLGHVDRKSRKFYSFNLENSERKDFISKGEPKGLQRVSSFVGNLVLLNEQTIVRLDKMEPRFTPTTFIRDVISAAAREKDETETSHKVQEEQGI